MVTFYPVWETSAGVLPTVTENDSASITLSAVHRAQFMGTDGQTTIQIGNSVTQVTEASVNGTLVSNSVVGQALVLQTPLTALDVVEITTSETLSYSLLHDNLPPGLTLSNTGVISGKVDLLPTDGPSLTYDFGVRVDDGVNARDRQFSIEAFPATVQTTPPGWGSLPSQDVQDAEPSPFSYVPLGRTTRGTPFQYQLNLYQPTGLPPTLVLQNFLGATSIGAPFNALPPGLELDEHTGIISGSVDVGADLGDYFFQISMLDGRGNAVTSGTGSTPLVIMIEVSPPFEALAPLRFIIWNTPTGSLTTVDEAQAFAMSVNATCTTGEQVIYTLSGLTPLPPGLTLNSVTGDIQGTVGHVPRDRTYTFTIRASVGDTFLDNSFSITVTARFNSDEFADITFKLRVSDTKPMLTYYNTVINDDDYFRPTDPNFGVLNTNVLTILLVGGLSGNVTSIVNTIRNSPFNGPITLLLGEHKIAYAQNDAGVILYEVLYREVVDPASKAGGYTLTNGVPVSAPVIYPQSPAGSPQIISPTTINNIRNEFVSELGFPTIDPSQANNLSLAAGSESLPLWMTSPQSGSDPSTILGYIPAVVLAYLKPGAGQGVLNRISVRNVDPQRPTDPADPVMVGHELQFDQYFIVFQTESVATTFVDPDMTLVTNATTNTSVYQATAPGDTPTNPAGICAFDGFNTVFDVYAYSGNKLARMNRATFNRTTVG